MHKILFYNKFIIYLYMFLALYAHQQEVKIVLYSFWYHHTETSEWSKITKIQLHKYQHMVEKFTQVLLLCINKQHLHPKNSHRNFTTICSY